MAEGRQLGGRAILAAVLLAAPEAVAASDADRTELGAVPRGEGAEGTVLALFQARADEPVRQFRARRRMRAGGLGRQAFMDVLVELDPATGFRWTVIDEGGSKVILDKALRRMLEKEKETREKGLDDRLALTTDNYSLSRDGDEPDGLARLRAVPRRWEVGLIDGVFVVTPDTADLVRIEGRLVRSPSFWVSRVEVERRYRRIHGHRVVVHLESRAHLRLLGSVHLAIDFDYEIIEGDAVEPREAPAPLVNVARTAAPGEGIPEATVDDGTRCADPESGALGRTGAGTGGETPADP